MNHFSEEIYRNVKKSTEMWTRLVMLLCVINMTSESVKFDEVNKNYE